MSPLDVLASLLAEHASHLGGLVFAVASALALVMRRRSLSELRQATAELEQARALTAFVRDAMGRVAALEARVKELEAELRASHGRERALLEELEALRESALGGAHHVPLPPRPRRDDTGRHHVGDTTRSLLTTKGT